MPAKHILIIRHLWNLLIFTKFMFYFKCYKSVIKILEGFIILLTCFSNEKLLEHYKILILTRFIELGRLNITDDSWKLIHCKKQSKYCQREKKKNKHDDPLGLFHLLFLCNRIKRKKNTPCFLRWW